MPYNVTEINSKLFACMEDDPFHENPIIYFLVADNFMVVIDTGCGSENLLEFLDKLCQEKQLTSFQEKQFLIINTHNHFDHVGSNNLFCNAEMGKISRCLDVCQSSRDRHYSLDIFNSLGSFVGCRVKPYKVTRWLDNGEKIQLSSDSLDYLEVLHCPGHTPDSICLYHNKLHRLFVGDFVYRYASVLAIGVKSSVQEYAQSCKELVDFIQSKNQEKQAEMRISCGHIEADTAWDIFLNFQELLQAVSGQTTRKKASVRSDGWFFKEFSMEDLSFTMRRGMQFDAVAKPIAKLYDFFFK